MQLRQPLQVPTSPSTSPTRYCRLCTHHSIMQTRRLPATPTHIYSRTALHALHDPSSSRPFARSAALGASRPSPTLLHTTHLCMYCMHQSEHTHTPFVHEIKSFYQSLAIARAREVMASLQGLRLVQQFNFHHGSAAEPTVHSQKRCMLYMSTDRLFFLCLETPPSLVFFLSSRPPF